MPTLLFSAPQYSALGLIQANLAINNTNSNPAIKFTQSFDNRERLTSGNFVTSTGAVSGSGVALYSYSIPAGTGYDGAGDLTSSTDSILGTASATYDHLNRLSGTSSTAGAAKGLNIAWTYDNWGNRLSETFSGTPSIPVPSSSSATYSLKNQVTFTQTATSGYTYDGAGHVTNDGVNQYAYDAEGVMCATYDGSSHAYALFVNDANGLRVAKATISPTSPPSPITSALCLPGANGYTVAQTYTYSPSGQQLQIFNAGVWQNDNIFGDGKLLATYTGTSQYYSMTDWIGTKRAQISSDGNTSNLAVYASFPYGNGYSQAGTSADANDLHFTGKETDFDTKNDYFGARFYGPTLGRFLSPDPIIMNDLRLLNPQRWNKYAYVINNPLTLTDPTGKDAAYVNFSGMASGFGHSGLLSIHPGSGSATYSRFGPMKAGQAAGAGEVQTDHELPSVQFGANGLPTSASYAALIQAVAQYEGVSPDTVGIDYFKTTDAETTNLDQYVQQKTDASNAGKAPSYCFIGSSCRDYALGGLVAGGAIDAWRTQFMSVVPNTLLNQLSGLADQYVPDATKATVKTSECDSLPDGTQRCQ